LLRWLIVIGDKADWYAGEFIPNPADPVPGKLYSQPADASVPRWPMDRACRSGHSTGSGLVFVDILRGQALCSVLQAATV
jgi:hypothetical protein